MSQFGSGNPYQTPPGAPYQPFGSPAGDRQSAEAKMKPVGIVFIVIGLIGGLGMFVYFILTLIGLNADPNMGKPPGGFKAPGEEIGFKIGFYGVLGMMVLNSLTQAIIIWGGFNMFSLSGRGVAMFAAVLSLIPCISSPCCVGGLPFGIWALIMLNDPIVKQHFR